MAFQKHVNSSFQNQKVELFLLKVETLNCIADLFLVKYSFDLTAH